MIAYQGFNFDRALTKSLFSRVSKFENNQDHSSDWAARSAALGYLAVKVRAALYLDLALIKFAPMHFCADVCGITKIVMDSDGAGPLR